MAPRHLVQSIALTLFRLRQHTLAQKQIFSNITNSSTNQRTMAEEKEELNIRAPEQTDQSEAATPDPSAPPEKKGKYNTIPTYIHTYIP